MPANGADVSVFVDGSTTPIATYPTAGAHPLVNFEAPGIFFGDGGTIAINNILTSAGGTLNCNQGTCARSTTGNFEDIILPELAGSLAWDDSLLLSHGSISVIPEPAGFALLAMGLVAGFTLMRWRK